MSSRPRGGRCFEDFVAGETIEHLVHVESQTQASSQVSAPSFIR